MLYPKRDEIVKEIGNCFLKKRPTKDSLYLFSDELLKNLNSESSHDFDKNFQDFLKETGEKKRRDREDIQLFVNKIEQFYKDYNALKNKLADKPFLFLFSTWSKHHQESGDLIETDDGLKRNVRYDDDGNEILIFPDKMKLLEEYMVELHKMLRLELGLFSTKEGRPKKIRDKYFLSLLYVMTECLLESRAGIALVDTPFRKIVDYCLSLVGDEIVGNFPYIMAFCFEDYSIVRNMAYKYKEYGRLDLFVEHVIRTNYKDCFREEFEDEWADWEKPINFNKLF